MSKIGEILRVLIPPCGHPVCGHNFMGCVKAVREGMGIQEPDWEKHPPGSRVQRRRIHLTGFPHRDWETVPNV